MVYHKTYLLEQGILLITGEKGTFSSAVDGLRRDIEKIARYAFSAFSIHAGHTAKATGQTAAL